MVLSIALMRLLQDLSPFRFRTQVANLTRTLRPLDRKTGGLKPQAKAVNLDPTRPSDPALLSVTWASS